MTVTDIERSKKWKAWRESEDAKLFESFKNAWGSASADDATWQGSDAAIKQGCICPVMDNHHGKGWQGQEGIFIQTAGCKVHSLPASKTKAADDEVRWLTRFTK